MVLMTAVDLMVEGLCNSLLREKGLMERATRGACHIDCLVSGCVENRLSARGSRCVPAF